MIERIGESSGAARMGDLGIRAWADRVDGSRRSLSVSAAAAEGGIDYLRRPIHYYPSHGGTTHKTGRKSGRAQSNDGG